MDSSHPRIVAIGLLTEHELELLGQGFDRAFPIDDDNGFEDLLRAIDEAERRLKSRNDTPMATAASAIRSPSAT